jgi:TfoX/Sxy family transcriptional regulator of competence genes
MEKWREPDERVIEIYEIITSKLVGIEQRKMFGCPCAFIKGNMFFGVFQDQLFLRLGDDQRKIVGKSFSLLPFTPMGRAMKAYITIPVELLADTPQLIKLVQMGVEHTHTLPQKVKNKKK